MYSPPLILSSFSLKRLPPPEVALPLEEKLLMLKEEPLILEEGDFRGCLNPPRHLSFQPMVAVSLPCSYCQHRWSSDNKYGADSWLVGDQHTESLCQSPPWMSGREK